MLLSIAIKVEKLSKEFVIGGALREDNFREYLTGLLLAPFRRFQELSGNVQKASALQRFKTFLSRFLPAKLWDSLGLMVRVKVHC